MPGQKWTQEEEDIIRRYYPSADVSARQIGKMIGRSRGAVKGKALKMGLNSDNNHWTQEEDEILKTFYENKDYAVSDIVDMLPRRKEYAIRYRAALLGLSRHQEWTEAEEHVIRENYANPNLSSDDIAEMLPGRTSHAVKARAVSLEITSTYRTDELKAMRNLYTTYKGKDARDRGLCFELTFEQFQSLITKPCHYCGSGLIGEFKRHDWEPLRYNGIDRVDPSKGYTIDNVVPCCKHCNRAKRERTYKEFRDWIRQVYCHWGQTDDRRTRPDSLY